MKWSASTTVVASDKQVSTELTDEAIILGLSSGEYYSLQDVGLLIWKMLATPVTVQEICDKIMEQYEVESLLCQQDVIELLQDMLIEDLIKVHI